MNKKISLGIIALSVFISPFSVYAEEDASQKRRGKPGGQGGQGRPGMQSPLQKALDANKDGVVDTSEMKNASQALASLDKNSDGKLSAEELRPSPPGGRQGQPPPAGNAQPAPKESGMPSAGGQQNRRGGMGEKIKEMDANGDGVLQSSEIPEQMRSRMLDRLDKNLDGSIDKSELMAAAKGMKGKKDSMKKNSYQESEGETGSGVEPKRPGSE